MTRHYGGGDLRHAMTPEIAFKFKSSRISNNCNQMSVVGPGRSQSSIPCLTNRSCRIRENSIECCHHEKSRDGCRSVGIRKREDSSDSLTASTIRGGHICASLRPQRPHHRYYLLRLEEGTAHRQRGNLARGDTVLEQGGCGLRTRKRHPMPALRPAQGSSRRAVSQA